MIRSRVRVRVDCDNEWQPKGTRGKKARRFCAIDSEVFIDGEEAILKGEETIGLAEVKAASRKRFEGQGWRFLPDGRTLCPRCEEMGKEPDDD